MAISTKEVLAIILGGGQGTRLYPLTKFRSKPAVPFGGKYRLIDIPISNCINSDIKKIFILTQFNSESLNRHIVKTYIFDNFTDGFVTILAAEQSIENTNWYQGTADAVRKNLTHIRSIRHKYSLILSGDQIYQMNFKKLLEFHIRKKADITVATIPVSRDKVSDFGIMKIDDNQKIIQFVEKPKDKYIIESLKINKKIFKEIGLKTSRTSYLASMGIYIFNKEILYEELKNKDKIDFGKEIIPDCIKKYNTYGFLYTGYWEDVGTIKAYFKSNLDFISWKPPIDFYSGGKQFYTHPRYLPATKFKHSVINNSIISEGCVIGKSKITNSIIGVRCIIMDDVVIENSYIMGNDYYSLWKKRLKKNELNLGIERGTIIKNAIIDKNVRIGKRCKIINKHNRKEYNGEDYVIRDGIIIITKDAVISDNTII